MPFGPWALGRLLILPCCSLDTFGACQGSIPIPGTSTLHSPHVNHTSPHQFVIPRPRMVVARALPCRLWRPRPLPLGIARLVPPSEVIGRSAIKQGEAEGRYLRLWVHVRPEGHGHHPRPSTWQGRYILSTTSPSGAVPCCNNPRTGTPTLDLARLPRVLGHLIYSILSLAHLLGIPASSLVPPSPVVYLLSMLLQALSRLSDSIAALV
ncbi:hypothetical protein B0J15DRAFT_12362 [Fusarium solani]|uniref:Secreted protein n=1 Tax=Fusarium solani TaxID=169388 RepID=A0A9P9L702_FUSSL|nr:uncharacterized protein B0J15DRAFT_12362 [Fusarium solani]KAH7275341.1 hypothetical protein B0J15DRAFT_12362 [Fusarium solani]